MLKTINNISDDEAVMIKEMYLSRLRQIDVERARILTILNELEAGKVTRAVAVKIEGNKVEGYPNGGTWVEKLKFILTEYGPQPLGYIVSRIQELEGGEKAQLMRSISATLSDNSKDGGVFTKKMLEGEEGGRSLNQYGIKE